MFLSFKPYLARAVPPPVMRFYDDLPVYCI
jgi:hypothetical protein